MSTRILIAIATGALVLPLTEAAAGPNIYKLRCRGGSGIGWELKFHDTGSNLFLLFNKGTKPAGPAGAALGPGECAWLDRPVSSKEPACILFYDVKGEVSSTMAGGGEEALVSPPYREPWVDTMEHVPGRDDKWYQNRKEVAGAMSLKSPAAVFTFWVWSDLKKTKCFLGEGEKQGGAVKHETDPAILERQAAAQYSPPGGGGGGGDTGGSSPDSTPSSRPSGTN